jgi:transcriptional regulator with XRE-family HTH domain
VVSVGELLREWRHRRRLSQLELALAAGISARHVSLVETGRSRPSADMVLRLAAQLDVPLRDRNRLLLAAGFAPRYQERPLGGHDLEAAHRAVATVLDAHEPYPAVVLDRRWDIVMTNRAFDSFLADVDPEFLKPPVNVIRLALHPHGLAPLIVNLAQVRAVFSARLSRQLEQTHDPEIAAMYNELLGSDTAIDDPASSLESEMAITMVVRHRGQDLTFFSTITAFGMPQDITLDEITIELYYPADAATADFLRQNGPEPAKLS